MMANRRRFNLHSIHHLAIYVRVEIQISMRTQSRMNCGTSRRVETRLRR